MPIVNNHFNRRRFLQGAGTLSLLASVPIIPAICVANQREHREHQDFWHALYETVMHPLDGDRQRAVAVMQSFYRQISPRDRLELDLGIAFFSGPFSWMHGHLSNFERLPLDSRQNILHTLQRSPADLYVLYQGLKELCQLAHYSQDASFERIGYSGPMVDAAMDMSEFNRDYDGLLATSEEAP